MRRTIKAAVAALAIAIGLVAATIQPAGATYSVTQAWHGARRMTDNFDGLGDCTSGPTFLGAFSGTVFKAMPRHCYDPGAWGPSGGGIGSGVPFAGVYEGDPSNWADNLQIVTTQAGGAYEKADMVLVNLGTGSAKSKLIFDYCNAGNCSSYFGGGSSNCNWCGSWWTITGYVGNPTQSQQYTKSGYMSGTSVGVTGTVGGGNYTTHVTLAGYDYWAYRLWNINRCGTHTGDSGSPIFYDHGSHIASLAGMLTNGGQNYQAGAGNGCYPAYPAAGSTFGTSADFISTAQIMDAFSFVDVGGIVPWY